MRRWLILVAVPIAALIGGVAVASIPDSAGVIHGCRKNSDGTLRVIDSDAGQTCANGWTALNWDQHSPAGTLYGAHILDFSATVPAGVGSQTSSFQCPSGERYISMAGVVYNNSLPDDPQSVAPTDILGSNSAPVGAVVSVQYRGVEATLQVRYTCARVTP